MTDPETLERDRAARRALWRERGVYADFGHAEAVAEGVARHGATRMVFHSRLRPREVTVAASAAAADRLAAALHRRGLVRGDRLAVMLPTWHETLLAYLAAFRLGLVVVPIVAIYGGREIGFIVRQTRAKALIVPDRWRGHDYLERVQAAGDMPDLQHLIVVGDYVPYGAIGWNELEAEAGGVFPLAFGGADEVCVILYTSGTTADPKGVKHTHNSMLSDFNIARAAPEILSAAAAAGPTLSVFPAGHIAGYLSMMRPVLWGAETVFMDQWSAEDAARLIERHRITSSVGTPIFLTTLMQAAEETGADISSLERFGLGAAAVTPENIRWTDRLGFPSGRIYGMTEHPAVSMGGDESFEKRAFTDGQIAQHNQVRILDDNDRDLQVGQAGEIATLGPKLFYGYVDERLDLQCFLPGGWFKTGDIGRLDAEGYLTITDRKKDIIIRGGENISAKEVEDALASLPGVIESAVTAMPDKEMGERVCAFVVAQPGVIPTLKTVDAHFRTLGLARQKTPERLVLVDELPRTPSGKVKKVELRERLRAEAVG